MDARQHDRFEGGRIGKPRASLAEGGQEASVRVGPGVPQCAPVLGSEGLVQREVGGVVHRGLDTQGSAFFQICLGLRRLVVDLELGSSVAAYDLGGEASRGLEPASVDHRAVTSKETRSGRPRSRWSPMAASNHRAPGAAGRRRRCRRPQAARWRRTTRTRPGDRVRTEDRGRRPSCGPEARADDQRRDGHRCGARRRGPQRCAVRCREPRSRCPPWPVGTWPIRGRWRRTTAGTAA